MMCMGVCVWGGGGGGDHKFSNYTRINNACITKFGMNN